MHKPLVSIFCFILFCSCSSHKQVVIKQLHRPSPSPNIEHELLTPEKSPWSVTEKKPSGPEIIDLDAFVSDWVGTPYRLGGNTKKGVDCSGFVIQVYLQLYQTGFIGRRAEDLFTEVQPVKKEKLVRGDLVFFKVSSRRIDHVGIYMGEGEFAHTSSSRGVMVSSLSEEYWEKHFFMGGRKIDNGSN